jgi:hypothetical protein
VSGAGKASAPATPVQMLRVSQTVVDQAHPRDGATLVTTTPTAFAHSRNAAGSFISRGVCARLLPVTRFCATQDYQVLQGIEWPIEVLSPRSSSPWKRVHNQKKPLR